MHEDVICTMHKEVRERYGGSRCAIITDVETNAIRSDSDIHSCMAVIGLARDIIGCSQVLAKSSD